MPFSFGDVTQSSLDFFTSSNGILGNPFTTAYIIGIITCIIIIFIMRKDNIKSSKVKLFKILIYTTLFASCLIFCQNTILMKNLENKKSVDVATKLVNGGDFDKKTESYVEFRPNNSTSVNIQMDPLYTNPNKTDNKDYKFVTLNNDVF
jgi:hypothetical protein